ncbi:TetR/AcrR family transcriptional regulator [Rhodopseudomonas sp.]|uniref:TetR/AcrR family transcriptional regulator n=1 Tax=Rhodopseudomonas sp. TaxID=1078 RepID=UPI003B3B41D5
MSNDLLRERVPEFVNERRRQQRSVQTRERILEVAYKEFAQLGFDGTSTRVIATKAGVNHPLVTYHFKTKEGLWRAVMTVVGSNFTEKWQSELAKAETSDGVTKLRLIQESFVRFAAAHPGYHWLMANVGDRPNPRLKWLLGNRSNKYFADIAELIKSAQKQGRYVDGDPYHLQYLFIGAVTRIFMQAAEAESVMGRSPFAADFVEQHVRLCCSLFFRDPPAGVKAARPATKKAAAKPAPHKKSSTKPAARTRPAKRS